MRIVSHRKLKEFYQMPGRGDAAVPLQRWYHFVASAQWNNISDLKADFPSADYIGNQRFVFNIGGNKYRLIVVVKFVMGYVFIRFVGTHQEYDKIDCSTI